jgi:hypothetical protein
MSKQQCTVCGAYTEHRCSVCDAHAPKPINDTKVWPRCEVCRHYQFSVKAYRCAEPQSPCHLQRVPAQFGCVRWESCG